MELVKNSTSFDLVIPREVEEKIRHLCSKVHDVEWSGTLFYKAEGSLDEGTFKATCLEHREELLHEGVYEGLVHSHNNMAK